MHMSEGVLYGRQLRELQFAHHAPNILRLNNGSFGACPRDVLQAQRALLDEWHSNPDDFYHSLGRRFEQTNRAVATRLLNARADDVVVVDNLTTGMAILCHSLIATVTRPDSVVMVSNHTYHAVLKAVNQSCAMVGDKIQILVVDIPFPILGDDHDDVIVACYQAALDKVPAGKAVRFAFLDHITSVPALRMPIGRIVLLLRRNGVLEVIVDAAHSPGLVNVEETLRGDGVPDYYLGNLHKWCMAPVAAAFLWVSPSAPSRSMLHHPIMSHYCGEGFAKECAMLGTKDYSAMLAVPAALDFIEHRLGGLSALQKYTSALCYEAAVLVSEAWGTMQCIAPRGLCTGTAMVGCPASLGDTFEDGEKLRLALRAWSPCLQAPAATAGIPLPAHVTGGIVIQKLTPVKGDRLYMRLSAAPYNYIEEYHVLRDAVLDIAAQNC